MRIACIAFTEAGGALARRAIGATPAHEWSVARGFGSGKVALAAWCADAFVSSDALVFVGAAGIAVRAIASQVRSKMTDPAVLVLDEGGRWCIPILSGHVGGANALAVEIADAVGATPVITTATDGRGLWAVDTWAVSHGMAIAEHERIKNVSARLLAGGAVALWSDAEVAGAQPSQVLRAASRAEAQVIVSPVVLPDERALHVVPPCIVAGIGCRRGTVATAIDRAFRAACAAAHVAPEALCAAATIELKRDEPGLVAWCADRGVALEAFSADVLLEQPGAFSASAFVEKTVGVDNVCERAAVAAGGTLVAGKFAQDGVTVALARLPWTCSFAAPARADS
ncbi:cobalamin biosynthesis protein [Collinsella tanakaei]|uniref:cobalt-precorrin 5A hydrolase n=1 Tax=Collinsella tanakaei TaxID=626935 RepID=UPI0025A371AE|nr:cobalamin biosynthesis protein [Collinsella tanakaei]MDM8245740.1 cobalamin biosynthesis protein [Collinsella tanakaei]